MRHLNSALRVFALAVAFLSAGCATSNAANPALPPAIYAVGDLHGDYDAYMAILKSAGLVDAKGRWTVGKSTLVQVGDVPDRGPDTKKIIESLMALEKQAAKKGGAVVALIGNHEAMNMTGDLRYTTPEEFAAFATRGSSTLRDNYFKTHVEELAAFYKAKDPTLDDKGVKAAFEKDVPLGYLEHRVAWSPKGKFGAWVLTHDAVRKIGDTVFVHGGISAATAATPIADINEQVRAALKAGGGAILTDEAGPLWYRGVAEASPGAAIDIRAALAAYGAKRVVMGHTPSLKGISSVMGGLAIVVDTGASKHYGGTRSYLKIVGDDVVAVDDGALTKIGESAQ